MDEGCSCNYILVCQEASKIYSYTSNLLTFQPCMDNSLVFLFTMFRPSNTKLQAIDPVFEPFLWSVI